MPNDSEVPVETPEEIPAALPVPSKEKHTFRNIFGTRRNDKAPPKVSDTEQELAHIKRLFSAQEAARLRAQEKVVDAHRQLKAIETETNRVRGELKRTQNELADTKEEQTADLRRAIAREAGLWNELVAVRVQVKKANDRATGYKNLVAICLVLLIPILFWVAATYWQKSAARDKAAAEIVRDRAAGLPRGNAAAPGHDFTSDVQRLDQALNRFRHDKAEDVLRAVHDANAARGISVCSFEWNGGQISMLFGSQSGAGLGSSVIQCANAVEQAAAKSGF